MAKSKILALILVLFTFSSTVAHAAEPASDNPATSKLDRIMNHVKLGAECVGTGAGSLVATPVSVVGGAAVSVVLYYLIGGTTLGVDAVGGSADWIHGKNFTAAYKDFYHSHRDALDAVDQFSDAAVAAEPRWAYHTTVAHCADLVGLISQSSSVVSVEKGSVAASVAAPKPVSNVHAAPAS